MGFQRCEITMRVNSIAFISTLFIFPLLILLTGCHGISSSDPVEGVTNGPTTITSDWSSSTPVGVDTTQNSPTITFTETFSPVISPVSPSSVVETITPVPLPTLNPSQTEEKITELLSTNGDCDFPCWWNQTPGETRMQEITAFVRKLGSLALIIDEGDLGLYTSWFLREDDMILDLSFQAKAEPDTEERLWGLEVETRVLRELEDEGGYEIVWEGPLNEKYLQAYSLPEILSKYGSPQDVLIFGNWEWPEFELVLDYADRGFAIWYRSPIERDGDKYLGCPINAYPVLYLWAPELEYSWAEGIARTRGEEDTDGTWYKESFISIEEATNLTLDSFYQLYIDPGNTQCIQTPVDIWRGP